MKKLYLLRHAKSSWDDPSLDDHDRPLAPRGQKAVKAMNKHMKKAGVKPDLVLCSTARRARETYQGVYDALHDIPVTFDEGVYTFSPKPLTHRLRKMTDAADAVMLIGHNPALESLALSLCHPDGSTPPAYRAMTEKYPTAALAVIDLEIGSWKDVASGCGVLRAFTRPRDLK